MWHDGFDISRISASPVIGLKSARVDHCTVIKRVLAVNVIMQVFRHLPLNFVVMGESWLVGSCSLNATELVPVMSTVTSDGGSGGRAWLKPSTKRFKVLARRPHATACFSLSPPAHPATQSNKMNGCTYAHTRLRLSLAAAYVRKPILDLPVIADEG